VFKKIFITRFEIRINGYRVQILIKVLASIRLKAVTRTGKKIKSPNKQKPFYSHIYLCAVCTV